MDNDNMTDSERIIRLETKIETQEKNICEIFEIIREIKNKLLGRPSWAITIIITALSSLSVSLIILLLK
jgi:uncharacterized coiled-coil protein SlyX